MAIRTFQENSKWPLTVPGDNSVDLLTQDIGLVLFTNKNGTMRGCNVYVGGGLGRTHNQEDTFARIAEPLGYVDAENIFDLLQSIMALQRDHGDREVRKHARMKYLLHNRGIEWFRETLIKDYFKREIKSLINESPAKLMDTSDGTDKSLAFGLWGFRSCVVDSKDL